MIIKVRPVTGGDFEVPIDVEETVETLKAVIISMRPDLGEDPDDVKLIYKGRVLANSGETIEHMGIKENEFLAMMVKKKPAVAAAAPTAVAPAATAAPAGAAGPDLSAALAAMQQQQQTPGALMGPPPEPMVAELCSMGFPKDQVMRALQAAYNNPDRAMGYLLDGNIPAAPEPMVPPQAQQPSGGAGGVGAGGAWPDGMLGPQLLTKGGLQPTSQALGGAPVVLLYFSAHWCPPCQRFTPMLAQAYGALGVGQKQVQVVFLSSDRDPGSFANYYGSMPWVAVPFGGPQAQMLGSSFGVRGIPAVVALDGRTGQVLDQNAREAITSNHFDLLACCRAWGVAAAPAPAPAPAALSPAAPAAAPAPVKNPEPEPAEIDLGAVRAALGRVSEMDPAAQETFYATLLKVLTNTLQNPQEPKFRALKKGNAALQSKLLGVADGAAAALLTLGGFEDGAESIALPGAPDGRCTAVRDAVQKQAEEEKMAQLRRERDAKIAAEVEEHKKRGPDRSFGGDENGRSSIGKSRNQGRGGG